ncbi:MAG: FtsX-like permease family protein [Roseivirga sp.]|nr:FtsX-like permease family protein [Roseivirga sp.]
MFKSYIKIAFRNLLKHKGYSFINIFGLTLGLVTSTLIFLYVQDELSYDRMHADADRVYRLENWSMYNGEENHWAATQGFLIPDVTQRYAEIETATRLMMTGAPMTFSTDNNFYSEEDIFYVDSTFFDVFSFEAIHGDIKTALDAPDKIILTEATAIKYFGKTDVVGDLIKRQNTPFKVSAVVENAPHNSHFSFDMLMPMSEIHRRNPNLVNGRGPAVFYSYIKVLETASADQLQAKMDDDIYEIRNIRNQAGEIAPVEGLSVRQLMTALTDIHLYSNAEKELASNGDAQYVYIFSTVAFFILLIACFNYMNLATARSTKRSKEVGMRKVLGAEKGQVFAQFLGESFFFTLLAMIIALVIVVLTIPAFNDFTGKLISQNILLNGPLMLGLAGVFLIVGLLSGFYPSLFLASFKPLKALKSNVLAGKGSNATLYLRRGLVILQFGISIFLIVGASTVYNQLQYIQGKDLGFDKEQVVVIKLPGRGAVQNLETIKKEFLNQPSVLAAASSSAIPGERVHVMSVRVPDLASADAGNENQQQDNGVRGMRIISGDEDLAETFDFEIVDGRDLSKEIVSDAAEGFLLNEAAIRAFGLEENPVGRRFEYVYGLPEPKAGRIVGVVKDFHYASLHSEIEPLMIHVFPNYSAFLNVRINTERVKETMTRLEETWNALQPSSEFDYFFLDSHYDNQYKAEMSLGKVIAFFTLLAVIIACMGLFGLASFITEQRTKEIGVRKVLGASIKSIMTSLSKEFVFLILLANILAWYPAYYFLSGWLEGFAFRVDISIITFVVAALGALLIALSTISIKTYVAARRNPVRSLRYE